MTTKWDLKLVAWPLVALKTCTRPIARRGHVTSLRSHFVIRPRRVRSIFSLTKESWPERLYPHHSPSQTLTNNVKFIFPWSSPLTHYVVQYAVPMWSVYDALHSMLCRMLCRCGQCMMPFTACFAGCCASVVDALHVIFPSTAVPKYCPTLCREAPQSSRLHRQRWIVLCQAASWNGGCSGFQGQPASHCMPILVYLKNLLRPLCWAEMLAEI